MKMEKIVSVLVIVGMILSESSQVGTMIVSKAALSDGMSNLIFIFYSNAIASLILFPFLFRGLSQRPTLTLHVLGWFFLLGILGCVIQFMGYAGIYYSSPTLCTAMLNLIPAFTFLLAITLRMEIFSWRSSISLAKAVGTMVSLIGASIVIFYDGPVLLNTFLSHPKLLSENSKWLFGGLLLVGVAVLSSFMMILQASILKKYPGELMMVFFYCLFVCIISAIASLVVERDLSSWSLESKTRLWSVLFSGSLGCVIQSGVTAWCLNRRGPVFVTMFKPIGIIISISVGVVFFSDTFYFGRLIGAIIIIAGFYSVLWAKAKEAKTDEGAKVNGSIESLESSIYNEPLLENSSVENDNISQ